MSTKEQLNDGKRWVEETFRRYGNDAGVEVEPMNWVDNFEGTSRLIPTINGKPYRDDARLLFTENDLTDVADDLSSERRRLERRIQEVLKSLTQSKKK